MQNKNTNILKKWISRCSLSVLLVLSACSVAKEHAAPNGAPNLENDTFLELQEEEVTLSPEETAELEKILAEENAANEISLKDLQADIVKGDSTPPKLSGFELSPDHNWIPGATYTATLTAEDTQNEVRDMRFQILQGGFDEEGQRLRAGLVGWSLNEKMFGLNTEENNVVPCAEDSNGKPTGFIGKYNGPVLNGYGADKIFLLKCKSSGSGQQKTIEITFRLNRNFGDYVHNDILFWARDLAKQKTGWERALFETVPPVISRVEVPDPYWDINGNSKYDIIVQANGTGSAVREVRISLQNKNQVEKTTIWAGYVGWQYDTYPFGKNATEQVACMSLDGNPAGFAAKYNGPAKDGYGGQKIQLVGCATEGKAEQKKVIFTIIPKEKFGEYDNNTISPWAHDAYLNATSGVTFGSGKKISSEPEITLSSNPPPVDGVVTLHLSAVERWPVPMEDQKASPESDVNSLLKANVFGQRKVAIDPADGTRSGSGIKIIPPFLSTNSVIFNVTIENNKYDDYERTFLFPDDILRCDDRSGKWSLACQPVRVGNGKIYVVVSDRNGQKYSSNTIVVSVQESDSSCREIREPVCGQVKECRATICPVDKDECGTVVCSVTQKTFSNRCELDKAGAEFLYDGECTISPPTNEAVTFTIDSQSADVTAGTNFHDFGQLTVANTTSELVLIDHETRFIVDVGGIATAESALRDIGDFTLRLQNNASFMTPQNPVIENGKVVIKWGSGLVLEPDEKVQFFLTGNISATAQQGAEYGFILDMSSMKITGLKTGRVAYGGPEGSGEFSIYPTDNPQTKPHSVHVETGQKLLSVTNTSPNDDTYVASQRNALVWQGIFRSSAEADITISSLNFDQSGTAVHSSFEADGQIHDTDSCSLFTKQGSVTTLQEGGTKINQDQLTFAQLNGDGVGGISLPAGAELGVIVHCDIASKLSSEGVSLIMRLDVSEVMAQMQSGNPVTVENDEDVQGGTYTLFTNGTLKVSFDRSSSPDNQIVIADNSSEPVSVAKFEFTAETEAAQVEDVTVDINAVIDDLNGDGIDDTYDCESGIPGIQSDCAISKVALFYEDGSPILRMNGAPAETIVNNGQAFFQDLDFEVRKNEERFMLVKTELRDITGSSVSRSGITFDVNLSLKSDNGESKVRGINSGARYGDKDILVADEDGENTEAGAVMYVFTHKIIASTLLAQPTVLNSGQNVDILRLNLHALGIPTENPFLRALEVQVSGTGTACIDEGDDEFCDDGFLYLYNDERQLIAIGELRNGDRVSGTWRFDIGEDGSHGTSIFGAVPIHLSELLELPFGSGKFYDEIGAGNETYRITADVITDGNDDALGIAIFINGNAPGTDADGIVWRDGSFDNGQSGRDVKWIDLGDDVLTNRLEHILSTEG